MYKRSLLQGHQLIYDKKNYATNCLDFYFLLGTWGLFTSFCTQEPCLNATPAIYLTSCNINVYKFSFINLITYLHRMKLRTGG